jgi:2-polyprenyl-3-methyl-5-hydroxy-6-metoxy-1,4-benzoquinol methylase
VKPTPHLQINQCISCGNSQLSFYLETQDYFLTQEKFELLKCDTCGLVLTNPVPNETDIAKYYNSPDYLSHKTITRNLTSIVYNLLRYVNIRNKYKFVNCFETEKSILDYGCGSGHLLHYFKKNGWKIQGVEPNTKAREIASKLNNTKILNNSEVDKLPKNSFDVITLWHVLEHIHSLNEVVNNLVSLLKQSGILIIAVPNINSPDALKYKEMWAGLDVPRHLYHFSTASMILFLSNHKLVVSETKPMRLDAYYVSLLSEKYKGNKFPYLNALCEGFISNKNALQNNYSSMIFVARKK